MRYGVRNLAGLLLILSVCLSCTEVQDGWSILMGNSAFQRGEFQKANLNYLAVSRDSKTQSIVRYNLGNVYNALGEAATAFSVWNSITDPASEELLFRLAFNRGTLLYQRGQYPEAYREFRTALLLKAASLDAKRNLELCLRKIQNTGQALPTRIRVTSETSPLPGDTEKAMLDYIQRLEGSRWKANNQAASVSSSVSDW